ncbi:unnamed protein product [Fusarium equiseti]|uniref:Uncharacterized protein n=1 Tax=Fusarium equiseti TaxID=61235 RepID=A0A8J2NK85_FUSEQ|nr:unnamed protein product [Fusarium equiseti]
MASQAKAGCSLDTTECIVETIASILSEIQEQNNEYNWDPLTFGFTAIIGAIAILFAALTALQAALAAGPGRTKSGLYAIVLTIDSFNFDILSREGSFASYQDPARLRKRKDDYFPATWLALLTHLSLDSTKLWDDVKLTGADFIPLELSAVPACGSIRFVVFLAMILSQGCGRLTIDRESGLPRVRDRRFNLIFRQHPLLGAIGFFEMYGEISFEKASRHIRMRLLQAHGHMNTTELVHGDKIKSFLNTGRVLVFNHFVGDDFISSFTANVERQCPHCNQRPKTPCLNMLEYLKSLNGGFFTFLKVYHTGFLRNGPLYLLMAPIPKSDLLPFFFPHKKAKLRERLDTLLLQNRFWGTKRTVYRVLSSTSPANNAHVDLQLTNTAVSWAQVNIRSDVDDLVFSERAYHLCSAFLEQSPTQKSGYDEESMEKQRTLQRELVTIDQ